MWRPEHHTGCTWTGVTDNSELLCELGIEPESFGRTTADPFSVFLFVWLLFWFSLVLFV